MIEVIPDAAVALTSLNKMAADKLERIKLVIIDICQLGGRTAFLKTIKEILPEASMVVTVPREEQNLAFTEEVINDGATMVAAKPFHKMFCLFVSALMY
ncbi:hypothetical protein OROMI_026744 [Orobanche minor]